MQAKKVQEQHKTKRQNVEAINKWKDEIKEKGEKAKDLSEFILGPKKNENSFKTERKNEFHPKNAKNGGGKEWKKKGNVNPREFNGKNDSNWGRKGKGDRKNDGNGRKKERHGRLNEKSKKIQKGFGMERNPKHKQRKMKRPGKVKRMMNKNKKFSGKR
jgi:hypothetical protein